VASWQREAARTRQPRLTKLHIPAAALCLCLHPYSSHTRSVFSGKCHVTRVLESPNVYGHIVTRLCDCLCFDARCGCGHLLSAHAWGTPPDPWACSTCVCKQFGARSE
jgi:hypothetical protein